MGSVPPAARCTSGARRRCRGRWRLPQRRRASVPREFQQALARIAETAGVSVPPSKLCWTLQPRGQEPRVRGSLLGKRSIRLQMPYDAGTTLGRAELEVLLATGLARLLSARSPASMLDRLSLAGVVLLAGLTLIVCWIYLWHSRTRASVSLLAPMSPSVTPVWRACAPARKHPRCS
jgi:hypothetical protein